MYTIKEAKEEIKAGIQTYLLKDEAGKYRYKETARMPFYLEGKPGIGKTEIVRQITEELGIGYVSFSITHHTRNTLLGLPVIVEEDGWKYTEYTMSEIIAQLVQAQKAGHEEGILLLDEFNCASETIFPMMLAMLQTRNIGHYKIPEGWNIVLCGNPPEFNRSARNFDAVILDRVRRLKLEAEPAEFLDYAREKNMHPLVIKYLSMSKVNVYQCAEVGDCKEVVTCRGWENLSHALYAYEELGTPVTVKMVEQFLKSEEIAGSFYCYYDMNRDGTLEQLLEALYEKKRWGELEKKLKNKQVSYLWNLLEQAGKNLEKSLEQKEKAEKVSKKISRVLEFCNVLGGKDSYKEHFFQVVTESKALRKLMLEVRNEEYLAMCRQAFALEDKDNKDMLAKVV